MTILEFKEIRAFESARKQCNARLIKCEFITKYPFIIVLNSYAFERLSNSKTIEPAKIYKTILQNNQ